MKRSSHPLGSFKEHLAKELGLRRRMLARLFRAARMEARLTQKNAADLLGYSCQADIAKIEKGGRAGGRLVDLIEIENLAAIYGKPLDYFATLEPLRGDAARAFLTLENLTITKALLQRRLAGLRDKRGDAQLKKLFPPEKSS